MKIREDLSRCGVRRPITIVLVAAHLLVCRAAVADTPEPEGGEKQVSGMSIVGNDEAPKSLVIVPWKSSDLGETLDVSREHADGLSPIDREVFSRELDYFELRVGRRE